MANLLTVEQVAKQIGFKPKSIYQMAYRGQLPYTKLGLGIQSPIRFKQEDVDAFVERGYHRTIKQQIATMEAHK